MAKRIKPIGGGKWCWTENCTEHGSVSALQPPTEEECVNLQKQSRTLMLELPSKQEIIASGNLEHINKAREAQINSEYARLHLAATSKGHRALTTKVREATPEKRPALLSLLNDSTLLNKAYEDNYRRFHYGATYRQQNGSTVRSIPVSMDNIASVNDWVTSATTDHGAEFDEDEELTSGDGAPLKGQTPTTKNKTKVFRKKNKLFYRNSEGVDTPITEPSYLVREGGDKFSIVPAEKFEQTNTLVNPDTPQMGLKEIKRERFFPPTNLSRFIQM